MKIETLALCICVSLLMSCKGVEESSPTQTTQNNNSQTQLPEARKVDEKEAVAIATKDAIEAGISLDIYETVVTEEAKQW